MRAHALSRPADVGRSRSSGGWPVVRAPLPTLGNSALHDHLERRGDTTPAVDAAPRTAGRPLDPHARALIERRFGRSFARVRVHTGAEAATSADAVGAAAYTLGHDIVFARGRYQPRSPRGLGLLAHELAHVAQQEAAPATGLPALGEPGGVVERQADAMGRAAARDRPVPAPTPAPQQVMRASRTFSLTFDDGPHAAKLGGGENLTENVLDTLKARSIRAGFFVQTGVAHRMANAIGRKLVARMHADGHRIGVHTGGTADHELHTKAEAAGRLEGELEAGKTAIEKATGAEPDLVRPPTGRHDKAVDATYAKVGLTNLLWDIDGDQGKNLSADELAARIDAGVAKVGGAGWKPTTPSPTIVVLLHDIQRGTSTNLGAIIDRIKATVVKVSGGKDSAMFGPP